MRVPPRKCPAPVSGSNRTTLAFLDPKRLALRAPLAIGGRGLRDEVPEDLDVAFLTGSNEATHIQIRAGQVGARVEQVVDVVLEE